MYERCHKRKEEHHKNLCSYRALYFPAAHSDLLHNFKALFILIAFGYLLIVDDQHGCRRKKRSEEDSDEEQSSEYRHEILTAVIDASRKDVVIFVIRGFAESFNECGQYPILHAVRTVNVELQKCVGSDVVPFDIAVFITEQDFGK